jgi:hypothetical protein
MTMSSMTKEHRLLHPALVHWDHAEIMDRAGPRPRDIRRLFEEYGLPQPTYRMLSAWRARRIPADHVPALIMMLADKGRLGHIHEVIVREDEDESDVSELRHHPRRPHERRRQAPHTGQR